MKNLLNLKGLCRSSQLALNPDGQPTVERRSNDGHGRRHLPVGLTKLLSLFLLLTLGVGQMWAKDVFIDLNEAPDWYNKPEINHGTGSSYSITVASATGISKVYKATIPDGHAWEVCRDGGNNKLCWTNDASKNKVRVYDTGQGGVATQIVGLVDGGGYIYFDNSVSNFTGTLYFVVGHDYDHWNSTNEYSIAYKMENLSGTSLYYVELSANWADATYYAVIGSTSNESTLNSNHSWGSNDLSTKGNKGYTAAYTGPYNLSSSNTYLITTASSGNNKAMTITWYNGYSNIPKNNMTIDVRTKIAGGSYGTSFNAPTSVYAQVRQLTNNGTISASASQKATVSTSAKTASKADVMTGQVDFSYTALADNADWQFDGWGTSSSGTSSNSSTYQITAGSAESKKATTIYAFFTRKPVLTVNCGSNGTSASGAASNNGKTSWNITATPASGYQFKEWTITAGSATFGDATSASTTATISADATITATFEEKTGGVITLTAGAGGQVSADNTSWGANAYHNNVTTTTALNIYARPNTGYRFNGWSKTSGLGTVTSTSTANTTFTPEAYEDATVTASFSEIMRTITISGGHVYGGAATSTTAGVATPAKITANAPAAGKKFTGWSLGAGVSLKDGSSLTDQTIEIYSTANATVTATYADRAQVKMYFAKPTNLGWSKVYAYAWGPSGHNATYPGVELENTEVINCVTYYTYQYYTESDGIGGAATGDATWNKIVFGDDNNDRKTRDLNIANGHYYYRATEANTSGKAAAITSAWGVKTSKDGFSGTNYITHNCATNSGSVNISFTGGNNYTFKVYNEVNDQWWSNSTAMGSSKPVTASMAAAQTLYSDDENNMQVNAALTGSYTFIVGSTNASKPTIKVTFPEVYAVVGSFNSWNSETNPLAMVGNTGTADIVLAPSGSNYTLKVVDNGAMYGKNSTTITTTATVSGMVVGQSNINLKADIYPASANPSYRFSYNKSTKALTVTYPAAHTVTYGVGTHAGTASVTSSISVASGKKILDAQSITFSKGSTNTGYTWKGWYNNAAGTSDALGTDDTYTSSSRAANTSVYACYNLVNYTITYNLNGGANPGGAPTGFTIESEAITLPTPTRTGYTFAGWYENADLSTGGVKTTIPAGSTGNKEYYAKWTPKTYTITLNQNGATTESTPTSLTATYDGKANGESDVFTLTNPEKTGYTFAGWYESEGGTGAEIITTAQYYKWENNPYVTTTGLWQHDGNVTVYAKWTPNNYAVTLSTTSETGYGSNAPANQTATYGADMPAITPPTPLPGYKFQGYFTEANGGGIQYYNADGTSANPWNIASATTLYAYFQKAEITALTHDAVVAKATTAYLTVNPTIVPASGIQGYLGICWTLLYDNGSEVAGGKWSVAPSDEDYQVRYTLNNLENGTYQVKAVLKADATSSFDPCSAGSELMNTTASFRVIGENTVTIRYVDADGNTLRSSSSVTIEPSGNADVVAPEIIGYTFASWQVGDGVTQNSSSTNTINISATYDGILTAKYNKKNMIYFNNTLGWEHVYVYFYSGAYWSDEYGSGANYNQEFNGSKTHNRHFWGEMTQIEGTNIWYLDYEAKAKEIDGSNWSEIQRSTIVSFTRDAQGYPNGVPAEGYQWFHETEAIYRGDFAHSKSMFVPLNEPCRTLNSTKYYTQGYWMNYPDNSGYTLKIYDNTTDGALKKTLAFPFAADKKMPMSITTDLEGAKTYGFTVERADDTVYGNNGTMTNGHSGDEGQGVWEFKTEKNRAGLTTSSAGDYTFTLTYGDDLNSEYNYLVGVHYPEATGDFRVQYKDNYKSTWKTSAVIPAGTEVDTVSYFVRKDRTPYIRVQKCTATYDGKTTTVTWNNENSGNNIISSLPAAVTENGVYNFIFTKSNGALILSKVEPYTGNFYIRVDGAGTTDWDNYRAADHLMAYSDYSFHQSVYPYSHYFTKWYDCSSGVKNIKFVVANDYSTNVSDTLARETATGTWANIADYIDEFGNLSRSANVRFMYNSETNEAGRVFIDGAYADGGNFLKILADASDKIYLVEEGGEAQTEITFTDKGNWVYEKTVYAEPGAKYKLRSIFGTTAGSKHEITQWFKGDEDSKETLIGGTGPSRLKIRLLYDFKTNRLVTAYVPSNTLSTPIAINADVMFVRDGQDEVEQITFTDDGALNEIKTVYSTLRFNKWTLNNRSTADGHALLSTPLSRYERDLFWVSFPYDVKVSDIIGFGTYGKHWIIEYYDGAKRARNGYWADTRGFWEFVTPAMKDTFTLKAGTGYLVALDLDELWWTSDGDHSDVWDNTSEVELLFPGNVNSISNSSVTVTIPSHECLINRGTPEGNRTIKDSHWNVIGVPTYLNTTGVSFSDAGDTWMTDGKPNYIYTWNMQDNTLSPVSAADFNYQSMYAYMVQYFGEITFTTSVSPAAAPHRNPDLRKDVEFRLELQQNNEATDHTFVRMSNGEDVTNGFAFGEDMSKEFCQSKANIYTLIGTEPVAGNVLPMNEQTTIVPVGVKIATEGEYTFAMPEGTESIGVVLKDNETGARTNLALFDYTVTLSKGAVNDRFVLEISPIANVPTALGNVQSDNVQGTKARKTIVDGIMYILRDGKIYDARGNKVK